MLARVEHASPAEPGDIFLPADDSFVRQAQSRGLTAETIPFADMRAVVLTAPGNPRRLAVWADLLREGVKVAVPNPAAAVGKLARERLAKAGRWDALRAHAIDTGTVTEAANAAKVGGVDAAVVWDAVATHYPGQTALVLPELEGVVGRVEVAVLKQSRDPVAASHFARYLAAPDHGLSRFREHGFRVLASRAP